MRAKGLVVDFGKVPSPYRAQIWRDPHTGNYMLDVYLPEPINGEIPYVREEIRSVDAVWVGAQKIVDSKIPAMVDKLNTMRSKHNAR